MPLLRGWGPLLDLVRQQVPLCGSKGVHVTLQIILIKILNDSILYEWSQQAEHISQ